MKALLQVNEDNKNQCYLASFVELVALQLFVMASYFNLGGVLSPKVVTK